MTPAGLAAVCADVAGRQHRRIVECGSGFSTLVLARLLHTRGGRLVSLEHDPTWAARVRSDLAAAGHAEIAQVALAPLELHPLARDGLQWYAQRALRSLPRRIDLLLVDGPPAFEPEIELSRYPALPALAERLVADATVVLDDIDRRGELAILKAWERDCGFRFDVRPAERIAVGRRRKRADEPCPAIAERRSALGAAGRRLLAWPLGTTRNAQRVPARRSRWSASS